MLENYEAAKEDRRAMCGDTGVPRWFVKMGNDAAIEGGMVALEGALRQATASATDGVPLRPNRVHPLWRTDHKPSIRVACLAPTTACYFPAMASKGSSGSTSTA